MILFIFVGIAISGFRFILLGFSSIDETYVSFGVVDVVLLRVVITCAE